MDAHEGCVTWAFVMPAVREPSRPGLTVSAVGASAGRSGDLGLTDSGVRASAGRSGDRRLTGSAVRELGGWMLTEVAWSGRA